MFVYQSNRIFQSGVLGAPKILLSIKKVDIDIEHLTLFCSSNMIINQHPITKPPWGGNKYRDEKERNKAKCLLHAVETPLFMFHWIKSYCETDLLESSTAIRITSTIRNAHSMHASDNDEAWILVNLWVCQSLGYWQGLKPYRV